MQLDIWEKLSQVIIGAPTTNKVKGVYNLNNLWIQQLFSNSLFIIIALDLSKSVKMRLNMDFSVFICPLKGLGFVSPSIH